MICTHISINMYKHLVITSFLKKHTVLPLYRHFLAFKRCLKHLLTKKKFLDKYEETVRCERKEKKELASIVVLIAVPSITTDLFLKKT